MMAHRSPRPTLTVVPPPAATADDHTPRRSDVELLAGVRRGDAGVAEDFYWRVRPVVARTVRRLLGRLDQDGEDIAQITMIQLIEALPRYRGDCPLDAWVSAVSANVVYKHIRRRRLERSLFTAASVEPADGEPHLWGGPRVGATGGAVQARELAARVGDHLAAMNAERAWAFLLHDVCGYSLGEVAQICRITLAAAQTRLSRGRRELHDRIADDPALRELAEGKEGATRE
jgi:RNA polymerase sigma-70 factor (ECF subfamily)